MGFWNMRAICPNCGAKIHTQGGSTGKVCPSCGVDLKGYVNMFTNKAKLASPPPKPTLTPEGSSARKKERFDRLEQVARLHQMGALSDEEFEKEKELIKAEPEMLSVRLLDVGPKKVPVIKAIREVTDGSLKETNEIVDTAPAFVAVDLEPDVALSLVAAIEAAGSKAEAV